MECEAGKRRKVRAVRRAGIASPLFTSSSSSDGSAYGDGLQSTASRIAFPVDLTQHYFVVDANCEDAYELDLHVTDRERVAIRVLPSPAASRLASMATSAMISPRDVSTLNAGAVASTARHVRPARGSISGSGVSGSVVSGSVGLPAGSVTGVPMAPPSPPRFIAGGAASPGAEEVLTPCQLLGCSSAGLHGHSHRHTHTNACNHDLPLHLHTAPLSPRSGLARGRATYQGVTGTPSTGASGAMLGAASETASGCGPVKAVPTASIGNDVWSGAILASRSPHAAPYRSPSPSPRQRSSSRAVHPTATGASLGSSGRRRPLLPTPGHAPEPEPSSRTPRSVAAATTEVCSDDDEVTSRFTDIRGKFATTLTGHQVPHSPPLQRRMLVSEPGFSPSASVASTSTTTTGLGDVPPADAQEGAGMVESGCGQRVWQHQASFSPWMARISAPSGVATATEAGDSEEELNLDEGQGEYDPPAAAGPAVGVRRPTCSRNQLALVPAEGFHVDLFQPLSEPYTSLEPAAEEAQSVKVETGFEASGRADVVADKVRTTSPPPAQDAFDSSSAPGSPQPRSGPVQPLPLSHVSIGSSTGMYDVSTFLGSPGHAPSSTVTVLTVHERSAGPGSPRPSPTLASPGSGSGRRADRSRRASLATASRGGPYAAFAMLTPGGAVADRVVAEPEDDTLSEGSVTSPERRDLGGFEEEEAAAPVVARAWYEETTVQDACGPAWGASALARGNTTKEHAVPVILVPVAGSADSSRNVSAAATPLGGVIPGVRRQASPDAASLHALQPTTPLGFWAAEEPAAQDGLPAGDFFLLRPPAPLSATAPVAVAPTAEGAAIAYILSPEHQQSSVRVASGGSDVRIVDCAAAVTAEKDMVRDSGICLGMYGVNSSLADADGDVTVARLCNDVGGVPRLANCHMVSYMAAEGAEAAIRICALASESFANRSLPASPVLKDLNPEVHVLDDADTGEQHTQGAAGVHHAVADTATAAERQQAGEEETSLHELPPRSPAKPELQQEASVASESHAANEEGQPAGTPAAAKAAPAGKAAKEAERAARRAERQAKRAAARAGTPAKQAPGATAVETSGPLDDTVSASPPKAASCPVAAPAVHPSAHVPVAAPADGSTSMGTFPICEPEAAATAERPVSADEAIRAAGAGVSAKPALRQAIQRSSKAATNSATPSGTYTLPLAVPSPAQLQPLAPTRLAPLAPAVPSTLPSTPKPTVPAASAQSAKASASKSGVNGGKGSKAKPPTTASSDTATGVAATANGPLAAKEDVDAPLITVSSCTEAHTTPCATSSNGNAGGIGAHGIIAEAPGRQPGPAPQTAPPAPPPMPSSAPAPPPPRLPLAAAAAAPAQPSLSPPPISVAATAPSEPSANSKKARRKAKQAAAVAAAHTSGPVTGGATLAPPPATAASAAVLPEPAPVLVVNADGILADDEEGADEAPSRFGWLRLGGGLLVAAALVSGSALQLRGQGSGLPPASARYTVRSQGRHSARLRPAVDPLHPSLLPNATCAAPYALEMPLATPAQPDTPLHLQMLSPFEDSAASLLSQPPLASDTAADRNQVAVADIGAVPAADVAPAASADAASTAALPEAKAKAAGPDAEVQGAVVAPLANGEAVAAYLLSHPQYGDSAVPDWLLAEPVAVDRQLDELLSPEGDEGMEWASEPVQLEEAGAPEALAAAEEHGAGVTEADAVAAQTAAAGPSSTVPAADEAIGLLEEAKVDVDMPVAEWHPDGISHELLVQAPVEEVGQDVTSASSAGPDMQVQTSAVTAVPDSGLEGSRAPSPLPVERAQPELEAQSPESEAGTDAQAYWEWVAEAEAQAEARMVQQVPTDSGAAEAAPQAPAAAAHSVAQSAISIGSMPAHGPAAAAAPMPPPISWGGSCLAAAVSAATMALLWGGRMGKRARAGWKSVWDVGPLPPSPDTIARRPRPPPLPEQQTPGWGAASVLRFGWGWGAAGAGAAQGAMAGRHDAGGEDQFGYGAAAAAGGAHDMHDAYAGAGPGYEHPGYAYGYNHPDHHLHNPHHHHLADDGSVSHGSHYHRGSPARGVSSAADFYWLRPNRMVPRSSPLAGGHHHQHHAGGSQGGAGPSYSQGHSQGGAAPHSGYRGLEFHWLRNRTVWAWDEGELSAEARRLVNDL